MPFWTRTFGHVQGIRCLIYSWCCQSSISISTAIRWSSPVWYDEIFEPIENGRNDVTQINIHTHNQIKMKKKHNKLLLQLFGHVLPARNLTWTDRHKLEVTKPVLPASVTASDLKYLQSLLAHWHCFIDDAVLGCLFNTRYSSSHSVHSPNAVWRQQVDLVYWRCLKKLNSVFLSVIKPVPWCAHLCWKYHCRDLRVNLIWLACSGQLLLMMH